MGRRGSRAPLLLAAVIALASAPVGARANPSVTVGGVTIEGLVSSINPAVDEYLGIPYGAASRWQPPRAPAALHNPFDATRFGAACPQAETIVLHGSVVPQSENCLVLNVSVPASATPKSALPVLVWIHGGELISETGVEYNASTLIARNDIVVVTINYRLGALGWLAHPALRAAAANAFERKGDTGDYGLMDQQFALQWVKRNIAAFGGDPAKVTIAGQSAGGLGVALNLASTTTAKGLFRAAIIESGAYALHNLPTVSGYESDHGDAFVKEVLARTGTVDGIACGSLTASSPPARIATCLDGASVATLLSVQASVFGAFGTSPAVGTLTVPSALQAAFSSGAFLRVPVLQGSNANEGRLFEPAVVPFAASVATVVAAGGPATYDLAHANGFCGGAKCSYAGEIGRFLAANGFPLLDTPSVEATLAADYPLAAFPDPYLAGKAPSADEGLSQILTDLFFACNALDSNTDLAGFVPVYAYELDDPEAPPIESSPAVAHGPNDQFGFPTASEHGAELQFLFAFPSSTSLTSGEQALGAEMQAYWANFVRSGNPGVGHAVPAWPGFKGAGDVENLAPLALHPFATFGTEHLCRTWQPILARE